ncbi:MAG: hypothetical protein JSU01_01810 [Bacteroidetes bacterium]|nr:hypothetical protein [Bacteroidota bacterium]
MDVRIEGMPLEALATLLYEVRQLEYEDAAVIEVDLMGKYGRCLEACNELQDLVQNIRQRLGKQ